MTSQMAYTIIPYEDYEGLDQHTHFRRLFRAFVVHLQSMTRQRALTKYFNTSKAVRDSLVHPTANHDGGLSTRWAAQIKAAAGIL